MGRVVGGERDRGKREGRRKERGMEEREREEGRREGRRKERGKKEGEREEGRREGRRKEEGKKNIGVRKRRIWRKILDDFY